MEWIFHTPMLDKQIAAIFAGDRQDRGPSPDS